MTKAERPISKRGKLLVAIQRPGHWAYNCKMVDFASAHPLCNPKAFVHFLGPRGWAFVCSLGLDTHRLLAVCFFFLEIQQGL